MQFRVVACRHTAGRLRQRFKPFFLSCCRTAGHDAVPQQQYSWCIRSFNVPELIFCVPQRDCDTTVGGVVRLEACTFFVTPSKSVAATTIHPSPVKRSAFLIPKRIRLTLQVVSEWACPGCTLVNTDAHNHCVLCRTYCRGKRLSKRH